MTQQQLDQSFYIIQAMANDGERDYPLWLSECGERNAFDLMRAHLNLKVSLVIESNPVEGWSRDITEDFKEAFEADTTTRDQGIKCRGKRTLEDKFFEDAH